jgi:hypothetical protein
MATPLTADQRSEIDEAKSSIRNALASGKTSAEDLERRVFDDGVTSITFRRARRDLRKQNEIARSGGGGSPGPLCGS